jgi:3-oxoacyl-[acyl-carrier-protein] synthase-3
VRGAKILGTGRALPPRVVTNEDLARLMDTSDEWIVQRTGIRERRFTSPGVGSSALGAEAARKAISRAGLSHKDIDFIVFATLTPDYFFPGGGVFIQEMLGLDTIGALDVRTQCTGFVYGLSLAEAYIKGGFYDRVLVIGSEVHSTGLDMTTAGRDVSVIFGDGAGAAVVGPADPSEGILSSHLHSEGKYAKELMLEAPASIESPRISHEMLDAGRHYPKMNGRYVFTHAVRRFPEVIREALAANGLGIADLSLVIPHQANLRITQAVAAALGVQGDKVYSNIEKYGNTTAASIPIALDECLEQGRIRPGDLVCLAAFGSGFTWAASLLRWQRETPSEG